jgi:hypothetical protein
MATQQAIKDAVRERLKDDNPSRLKDAGDNWQTLPLGFFYATSEDAVDLAMLETVQEVIDAEGRRLDKQVFNSLRKAISLETKVKAAIMTLFLANLASKDQS